MFPIWIHHTSGTIPHTYCPAKMAEACAIAKELSRDFPNTKVNVGIRSDCGVFYLNGERLMSVMAA